MYVGFWLFAASFQGRTPFIWGSEIKISPLSKSVFPQQRTLMGSSAQNSSGVHWCSRRVRFNKVPEKVPNVPEKVWEAWVQSQLRFSRIPEKVPKVPDGEGSGEGLGGFGAEPGQVQQGSREGSEGSGEGLGGFGAEPGQVQQGSGEGSGEVWCRARSGSTGFQRRLSGEGLGGLGAEPAQVQEGPPEGSGEGLGGLVQSQVKLNRVLEKILEKVWEALVQSQVRFNRVPEKAPEKIWVWCRAKFNRVPEKVLTVPGKVWEALVQSQLRFNRIPEKVPEKVWEVWCSQVGFFTRVPEIGRLLVQS